MYDILQYDDKGKIINDGKNEGPFTPRMNMIINTIFLYTLVTIKMFCFFDV